MGILNALFRRKQVEPEQSGPLYQAVSRAMSDVQSYARSHGGEIKLISVSDEGEVKVRLTGACRGCPMSSLTLKLGIEQQLRVLVPGITRVTELD